MSTIEIQFEKRIDNSRVVREADARCRLEYICLTLLGAMFVFGALFYAWQQYQWIQYGYLIEDAQRQIEQLDEVGRQLRVERATLANPLRIDSIARGELGMVGPEAGQIVTLEEHLSFPALPEGVEALVAQRGGSITQR